MNNKKPEWDEMDLSEKVQAKKRGAIPGEPRYMSEYRDRLIVGSHAAHHIPLPDAGTYKTIIEKKKTLREPTPAEKEYAEKLQENAKKNLGIP